MLYYDLFETEMEERRMDLEEFLGYLSLEEQDSYLDSIGIDYERGTLIDKYCYA